MTETAGKKVAVAMSGGVDSSAAAALLKDQGYDVFGITAIMSSEFSRCCSAEDVKKAKELSAQLGMPHHIVELKTEFKADIIDYFVREYLSGRTPSPCAICNKTIKFGGLMDAAFALGADYMATGHYSRVEYIDGKYHLLRGLDKDKDQSYFLFMLNQEQLSRSLFPLAGMVKKDVTRYALERDLSSRNSKESQELCFVNEVSHGEWIDLRSFDTPGFGDVVDTSGKKLGTHKGIHHYTIGQRRGLGIAAGKPVYIVRIDAEQNLIVVGDKEEAMRGSMTVSDVNWITGEVPAKEFSAFVKIRYNNDASEARVIVQSDGSLNVVFTKPQFAVTSGQIAAFYDDDELIGGGWID